MTEWLAWGVFSVGVLLLTGISAYTDTRSRKIPNWLTVSAFVAGIAYQAVFHQWPGVWDAGRAFGVGFGTFFVLWTVGSGGGGDAKLIGALSVWLGLRLTLYALVLSLAFVLVGTVVMTAAAAVARRRRTEPETNDRVANESDLPRSRRERRVMAYAVPMALSVWLLMLSGLAPGHGRWRMERSGRSDSDSRRSVRGDTAASAESSIPAARY